MIRLLKTFKSAYLKTISKYKQGELKSISNAIDFFNLRFFYNIPQIRYFYQNFKKIDLKKNEIFCEDLGFKFNENEVIKDLFKNGISKSFLIIFIFFLGLKLNK